MDRKVYASLLFLLIGVALAPAGPVAGDMKATFAGTAGAYSMDAAVRQLMSTSKLEDSVASELTVDLEVHSRVLGDSIRPQALYADKQACIGPCPGRGGRYTPPPRPCYNYYQCPS